MSGLSGICSISPRTRCLAGQSLCIYTRGEPREERPLPPTLPAFKAATEKLIRRFESDRDHYLSKGYSEAQSRVDFITPFFKPSGWDVENEAGLPHHSREVLVEAAEDIGGRPDYNSCLLATLWHSPFESASPPS